MPDASVRPSAADLQNVLRDSFGLDEFRPGQQEAAEAVLAGRDALVIMPTGSGKSLIYQLPALLLPGAGPEPYDKFVADTNPHADPKVHRSIG